RRRAGGVGAVAHAGRRSALGAGSVLAVRRCLPAAAASLLALGAGCLRDYDEALLKCRSEGRCGDAGPGASGEDASTDAGGGAGGGGAPVGGGGGGGGIDSGVGGGGDAGSSDAGGFSIAPPAGLCGADHWCWE